MTSNHELISASSASATESPALFLNATTQIADAERLRESALALVANGGDVTVVCDDTDYVDASILQLLLALKAALQTEHRKLRFTGVSTSLADSWCRVGFEADDP